MINIYICYNTTGKIELFDEVSTEKEANIIIQGLIKEDEEAMKHGVLIEDCTYFARKE